MLCCQSCGATRWPRASIAKCHCLAGHGFQHHDWIKYCATHASKHNANSVLRPSDSDGIWERPLAVGKIPEPKYCYKPTSMRDNLSCNRVMWGVQTRTWKILSWSTHDWSPSACTKSRITCGAGLLTCARDVWRKACHQDHIMSKRRILRTLRGTVPSLKRRKKDFSTSTSFLCAMHVLSTVCKDHAATSPFHRLSLFTVLVLLLLLLLIFCDYSRKR